MNRDDLERAISALEELLVVPDGREESYQQFFETHTLAFEVLGYESSIPKPRLKLESGYLEPDFIASPRRGLPELIDLKTPNERILLGRTRREKFSASLDSYISQLQDYQEYFDEQSQRDFVHDEYGLAVPKDPSLVIIAGRDASIDKVQLHHQLRRRGGVPLRILTFDDVLLALRHEHQARFGELEDLQGASIFMLAALRNGGSREQFYWDLGTKDSTRISVFLSADHSLTFRVVDASGSRIEAAVPFETSWFNEAHTYGFEFGVSERTSIAQIRIDDRLVAEAKTTQSLRVKGLDFEAGVLGADLSHSNNAAFDVGELVVYSRVLRFEERRQLNGYFFGKWLEDLGDEVDYWEYPDVEALGQEPPESAL